MLSLNYHGMVKLAWHQMLSVGLRHPFLAMRYLRGLEPSEFSLRTICRYVNRLDPIIVEAGAFDGRDTLKFADAWPSGRIYAFEPIPSLAAELREKTSGFPNVRVQQMALIGSDAESVEMFTFGENDDAHGSSSVLRPTRHLEVEPSIEFGAHCRVPATSLKQWLLNSGESRIDLLWLDLQGAELSVLQYDSSPLNQVSVCHVEVSREPLYEGAASFKELKHFFEQQGFELKKVRLPVMTGNAIFVRRPKLLR